MRLSKLSIRNFRNFRSVDIPPDFTTDLGLLALLTDFRTAGDPTIARLSYIFQKKADVTGIPQSSDD